MITEREKLEFESLPEFVREPRPSREPYASKPVAAVADDCEPAAPLPKSAELEALWPGVSQEFLHHAPKKGPSFYLTIGFMAGAVVSLLAAWGISCVSHLAAAPQSGKEIVVAAAGKQAPNAVPTTGVPADDAATILPVSPTYEVAAGDTLAGIALKNYHRVTPRLLDEICKANNMRNANVLSLGQKLVLPEYHPQSRQIATGASQAQQ